MAVTRSSQNRAKFTYLNYDQIQDCINNGDVDAYDIIYTKDTHENLIIAPDYTVEKIRSRVYRFIDVESAELFLNQSPDTYEGQIISIVFQNKYVGYIVNRNLEGKYYVSPLSIYSGQVDYNTLGNRPIINITGTLDDILVVDSLETGQYKIVGQYKISHKLDTIFNSTSGNIFLVEKDDKRKISYIKRISASEVTDYVVSETGDVTTSIVPTTEWLKAQGYVTEGYVDIKIAALDFITKEEIEKYVSNVVIHSIDSVLNDRIEHAFDERFVAATETEARDVFTQIFK